MDRLLNDENSFTLWLIFKVETHPIENWLLLQSLISKNLDISVFDSVYCTEDPIFHISNITGSRYFM